MISPVVRSCKADILPVVNSLVSEADKVCGSYGKYETYGASLGIEALEAIKRRNEIGTDEIDVSEIDLAYSERTVY